MTTLTMKQIHSSEWFENQIKRTELKWTVCEMKPYWMGKLKAYMHPI